MSFDEVDEVVGNGRLGIMSWDVRDTASLGVRVGDIGMEKKSSVSNSIGFADWGVFSKSPGEAPDDPESRNKYDVSVGVMESSWISTECGVVDDPSGVGPGRCGGLEE